MIINRASVTAAFVGFNAAFNAAMAQFGAESQWRQIAMEVPSSAATEEYGWLGKVTRFREWLGDRVVQALMQHGYAVKNKTWENTVEVSRDDIEDDRLGLYTKLFEQLGQDTAEFPDTLVFALLAAGFTTTCYDGQYFFDTDHPVLDANGVAQSVSNHGGGAGRAWFLLDTSRVLKPLIYQNRRKFTLKRMDGETDQVVFERNAYQYGVDGRCNVGFGLWQLAYGSKQTLDATNFNSAYAAMAAMKGDHGKPLGVRPKLLVVAPQDRTAALEVVKAERNAAGATNINRDAVDVLICPWLA